jgi:predicted nuclease of predicted toxin-antitoxin system
LIAWVDAQLSPALAPWLAENFEISAYSARFLGLRDAKDPEIFSAAREAGAVVLTKDHDFVLLVERLGPPPQVVWITCGNTSNARLRQVLTDRFPKALELLRRGEPIVEISDSREIR